MLEKHSSEEWRGRSGFGLRLLHARLGTSAPQLALLSSAFMYLIVAVAEVHGARLLHGAEGPSW